MAQENNNFDPEMREWKEFANLLEQYPFGEFQRILGKLKQLDKAKYYRFLEYLDDNLLWAEVCRHKIALAILVAEKTNVKALENDRTRIVLTLAKIHGRTLEEANKELAKEFGDYFKLLPSYVVSGRSLSFRDITKKAAEIRNGLRNICCLEVEDTVQEIMVYYRSNAEKDKSKLQLLKEATFALMTEMRDPQYFMNPKVYEEIKPKLKDYYRLTNRTQLDTKALDGDVDFDAIAKFVYIMAEVVATKLELIGKNHPINDFKKAREIIFKTLAGIQFKKRISVEETLRIGIPLPKKA